MLDGREVFRSAGIDPADQGLRAWLARLGGWLLGGWWCGGAEKFGGGGAAVDDGGGEFGESVVVVAGVIAEEGEGFVGVDAVAFGKDALGLFDEDAAVEGGLKLVDEGLVVA